MCVKLQQLSCL